MLADAHGSSLQEINVDNMMQTEDCTDVINDLSTRRTDYSYAKTLVEDIKW